MNVLHQIWGVRVHYFCRSLFCPFLSSPLLSSGSLCYYSRWCSMELWGSVRFSAFFSLSVSLQVCLLFILLAQISHRDPPVNFYFSYCTFQSQHICVVLFMFTLLTFLVKHCFLHYATLIFIFVTSELCICFSY